MARFGENIEATLGQALQHALSASSASSNVATRNRPTPPAPAIADVTAVWPAPPTGRFSPPSNAQRTLPYERESALPVAASWLDGQIPLTALNVPLWKTVDRFSSLVPETWRPVLRSKYSLAAVILVFMIYPLGRLIRSEIANRREERDLALYD
jgi:hypothetical protein